MTRPTVVGGVDDNKVGLMRTYGSMPDWVLHKKCNCNKVEVEACTNLYMHFISNHQNRFISILKLAPKKFVLHDPKQRRCGDAKKTKRGGLCVNGEKSKSCWTTTQQADI